MADVDPPETAGLNGVAAPLPSLAEVFIAPGGTARQPGRLKPDPQTLWLWIRTEAPNAPPTTPTSRLMVKITTTAGFDLVKVIFRVISTSTSPEGALGESLFPRSLTDPDARSSGPDRAGITGTITR